MDVIYEPGGFRVLPLDVVELHEEVAQLGDLALEPVSGRVELLGVEQRVFDVVGVVVCEQLP